MAKRPHKQKFWRYCALGIAWMALFRVIDWGLEKTAFYRRLESANLDALLVSRNATVSSRIFVVWITDDDYSNPALFAGTSPLRPEGLISIIKAIGKCGPKTVGVDFDTSAWTESQIKSPEAQAPNTRMVWARAADAGSATQSGQSTDMCYGWPVFLPDEDGIVRQYREYIPGGPKEY